jgi:hypothetical protein
LAPRLQAVALDGERWDLTYYNSAIRRNLVIVLLRFFCSGFATSFKGLERELSQLAASRQRGRRGKTRAGVASHALRFEPNRAPVRACPPMTRQKFLSICVIRVKSLRHANGHLSRQL